MFSQDPGAAYADPLTRQSKQEISSRQDLVKGVARHGKTSEGTPGFARRYDQEAAPQAIRGGFPRVARGSSVPRRMLKAWHRHFRQYARKRPWSGDVLAGWLALSAGAAGLARDVEAVA